MKRGITPKTAERIATTWHGGQWSPLYAFACSGLHKSDILILLREIQSNLEPEYFLHPCDISKTERSKLSKLKTYIENLAKVSFGIEIEWYRHKQYGYLYPSVKSGDCSGIKKMEQLL